MTTTCPHCGHFVEAEPATYSRAGAAAVLGVHPITVGRMLADGRLVASETDGRGVVAIDGDSVRAEAVRRGRHGS